MPNIKVVTPRRSPLQDIVIDLEETVNPLSQSRASVKSNKPPAQPSSKIDEEDPDAGQDSDDDAPLLKVVPVDRDYEQDKS